MAGKLILLFNDEVVREYALDQESIVIGRRPSSDVHIDNLAVSGSHARVLTILKDSFLEDLGSTNGVYVNGQRIRKHALADGDLITIGKHQLRYVRDQDATAERGEQVLDTSQTALGSRGATGAARLRLLTDAGPAKELLLTKALTTVGKPGVQVAAISRRHQGDFIVHVDGGADNKAVPVVNGTPIGYRSYLLRHQDIIEIAGVKMEYLKA
jgi:pSer/pThr/pTyr-binding forkhead associated (FHA) protein